MKRPKVRRTEGLSEAARVRLHPEELQGLKKLAAALNVPPSRIMRRLLREAINGGPDYFDDGVLEIRMLHVHLSAVGRNLNQLVRAANRGEPILNADVQRVVDVLRLQVAAIEDKYLKALGSAGWRAVRPLYDEAGLPSPFDHAEAADDRPARHPGRGPGQVERDSGGETAE